jgi:hypothetical protein
MTTTTDTTTTAPIAFDVYVFGSRSAATAALTCAMVGGNVDPKAEAMIAAWQGVKSPKQVAGRVNRAADRAGLPKASETVLARRIVELVKGQAYGTMPFGDGDRTIVFVPVGGALPLARTLKKNADARLKAARPALKAAADLKPRLIAA